jgi:RimJ/RimL family protein N-acetyltransferase/ribosomal protein S18 acetylase RimI-like enzyme
LTWTADLTNWTARQRPGRTVLAGRWCRLEPLDAARHGDDLHAASSAPGAEERFRWLAEDPPAGRAVFQSWLDKAQASEDPMFFAVLDAAGRAQGRQAIMRHDPANGVAEIGHILWGPAIARGRVATQALALTARYLFEDLGYRRFEWKCNDLNEPSKAAARRFGFTPEGVFRQHMVAKGSNRDTAWFAMLDREWPVRRRAFDLWLSPDNFDENGRQRLRLSVLGRLRLVAPDGLVLRRADMADADALTRLQQAAYAQNRPILGAEPLPLLTPSTSVLNTMDVFVNESNGELNGAIVLHISATEFTVWSVATHPDRRGEGLGNAMLAAAEAHGAALGFSAVRLCTGAPLTRNIGWYQRHGYRIERVEELADRSLVHLVKPLAAIS